MAADLAAFQATKPTTPSWRLKDVLSAMEPALQLGFAWSLKQAGNQVTVMVMHRGGWDLQSTTISQGTDETVVSQMLADLLGISLAEEVVAAQSQHTAMRQEHSEVVSSAVGPCESVPDFADEVDEFEEADAAPQLTQPLGQADISTCLAMLKALPADARKSFTIAFRSNFKVPREERTISKFITDEQHKQFIQSFVDELELQEAPA